MSPLSGGSKPGRGGESGKMRPGQMAHFSPKVAQTKRLMAHPVRRGPLWAVRGAIAGALPNASDSGPDAGSAGRAGRFAAVRHRRRELAAVFALLIVAAVVSASLPGGWARPASATPSGQLAADPTSPDPTESAGLDSPEPSATESPSAFPTPSGTPTLPPTPKPTVTPKKTVPRVYSFVTLGDSLTAWPVGDPWPTRLDAEDARLHLAHNAGVPGDLVSDMLARLQRDVFDHNPDVLFILGGTNDIGRGYGMTTALANLKKIIIAAKAKKIRIYLITLPPTGSSRMAASINEFNAALVHLGNSNRLVVINIHDVLSTSSGVYVKKYTIDGIHFTSLGAQVVANTIYARVHRLGY